jgi:ATP-dependent helicase/nuclease subunit B
VSGSGERVSLGLLAAAAAGHTILAPNSELATAVFAAIERAHRDQGRDIWPTPKVLDFATWLREQYASRQLASADSPRCLAEVEERELWRSIIETEERGRDFLDPAAAARAARRARRAVAEYGIPLQLIGRELSEESEAFLKWNQAFDERCRALQCISADVLLARTGAPQGGPLAWVESPAWRPVARQWLARNALLLTPEDILAPRAAEPAGRGGARKPPLPSVSRVGSASPAAELAALAAWVQFNLQADEHFRAWVCIPDLNQRRADVVDAMDAALARQRFSLRDAPGAAPYAVAGGTPLAGFAPVRVALETLTCSIGAVSFPKFSVLLRAPEMQPTHADAGAAAALDLALRSHAPSEADIDAWLSIAERVARSENMAPVAAVQRLRAVRSALTEPRNAERISVWVSAWIAALDAGPWAERGRWSSIEYQAAERFRELLAELATAESLFGINSLEAAVRVLKRAAHDTAFQPQTGVPAIWVSGQLIDPWVNYDAIWVTRCSDEYWPPRVEPIALLPVRLQREHGVISAAAETQLNLALDLQRRWRVRATHCVFSFADPGDGRSSAPSPLLPPITLPQHERYWAELVAAPQPHWRALLDAAPALECRADESAPPFSAGERTRGVSTLRAQSRCAFRGFAETRLAAKALEQPVPGFNERERGDLVHLALQHVWSVLRNSNELLLLAPGGQRQLLDEAAMSAIGSMSQRRDPGPRWRARERARLRHLLTLWLDVERKRAPFAVEYLEQGAQVAQFAGLDFTVRVDRMDRLADGARVLIDYKTGAATIADWRGDRPDNPQLPIYALLRPDALVAVAYARVNAGDSGFIAEAERRDIFKLGSRSSALEGMPNFAALVGLWSRRVERLAAAFAAGRAEVAPTLNACQTCKLHGLCRVPAAFEPVDDAND